MHSDRLAYLFKKYIDKSSTPSEKIELMELLESDHYNEELKLLLGKLIEDTEPSLHLPQESGEFILQKIIKSEAAPTVVVSTKRQINISRTWIGVAAASIIVLAMIGYFTFFSNRQVATAPEVVKRTMDESSLQVSTAKGERRNIRLADGTQVWLSPSSSLVYPAVFNDNSRRVQLLGEAFFEVARDTLHPFLITSGNIETKVLGTSFNIRAYENQDEIAVLVVSGRVNVRNTKKIEKVDLNPNERAVFHRQTTRLVKEVLNLADAPNFSKRKEGMFIYKNEKLQTLIDDLREYFGADIQVATNIRDCKVTANFYVTDDLAGILEPIAIALNGSLKRNAAAFFIEGSGCP